MTVANKVTNLWLGKLVIDATPAVKENFTIRHPIVNEHGVKAVHALAQGFLGHFSLKEIGAMLGISSYPFPSMFHYELLRGYDFSFHLEHNK